MPCYVCLSIYVSLFINSLKAPLIHWASEGKEPWLCFIKEESEIEGGQWWIQSWAVQGVLQSQLFHLLGQYIFWKSYSSSRACTSLWTLHQPCICPALHNETLSRLNQDLARGAGWSAGQKDFFREFRVLGGLYLESTVDGQNWVPQLAWSYYLPAVREALLKCRFWCP
jgi:hypothetical protein